MKNKIYAIGFLMLFVAWSAKAQQAFKVEVKGTGTPVMFFPGFGCPGELWSETVEQISENYECHVFTFAGFGTVPPIETPWFETIKTEIETYVKALQPQKPILVGHSLGGTLALWLASSHSDWYGKVIAVDALPCYAALMLPNYNGEKLSYDTPQSNMMIQMDTASFQAMNAQSVSYMSLKKDKHKLMSDWMNVVDRQTYVRSYIDMLNLDLREGIAAIQIPVVVLAAANPNLQTVKPTYDSQYQKLPGVKFLFAEQSAHFIMFDQPEWFIRTLTENLK